MKELFQSIKKLLREKQITYVHLKRPFRKGVLNFNSFRTLFLKWWWYKSNIIFYISRILNWNLLIIIRFFNFQNFFIHKSISQQTRNSIYLCFSVHKNPQFNICKIEQSYEIVDIIIIAAIAIPTNNNLWFLSLWYFIYSKNVFLHILFHILFVHIVSFFV